LGGQVNPPGKKLRGSQTAAPFSLWGMRGTSGIPARTAIGIGPATGDPQPGIVNPRRIINPPCDGGSEPARVCGLPAVRAQADCQSAAG